MRPEDLIRHLNLAPHPEGGFYRETYRSPVVLPRTALSEAYDGDRSASTCIYYMLFQNSFSYLHKVASDEIFHFYAGNPVEMLQLNPVDGTSKITMLGSDVLADQRPQLVVPAGIWQGCRLVGGGEYALMGCTVAPGFEFADYELAERSEMCAAFPDQVEMITALTRD